MTVCFQSFFVGQACRFPVRLRKVFAYRQYYFEKNAAAYNRERKKRTYKVRRPWNVSNIKIGKRGRNYE